MTIVVLESLSTSSECKAMKQFYSSFLQMMVSYDVIKRLCYDVIEFVKKYCFVSMSPTSGMYCEKVSLIRIDCSVCVARKSNM